MLGACAIAESAASRRRAHSTVARSNAAFVNMLDALSKIVYASRAVNQALGKIDPQHGGSPFVRVLLERLGHPDARVRLLLLRVLTSLRAARGAQAPRQAARPRAAPRARAGGRRRRSPLLCRHVVPTMGMHAPNALDHPGWSAS